MQSKSPPVLPQQSNVIAKRQGNYLSNDGASGLFCRSPRF